MSNAQAGLRYTMLNSIEIVGLVLTARSDYSLSDSIWGTFTYEALRNGQTKRGFDSPHPLPSSLGA